MVAAKEARPEVLGQGLLRAATRAINLGVAGTGAAGSLVLQSWPLLGVSLAGYAALVAWDLSRLGFWKRLLADLRLRAPLLPDPDSLADAGARHFANRLHQARIELRRVLDAAHGVLPACVARVKEALPQAEKRAVALIARLEEVSRYLADKNLRGLRGELDRLRRAREGTDSPRLEVEYRKAQETLQQTLGSLEEIAGARDLLTARLETLTGYLELFPCAIVCLQVFDAEERETHTEASFDPGAIKMASVTHEAWSSLRWGP